MWSHRGPSCRSSDSEVLVERLLLYLDDIDDLIGAAGLLFEQFRRLFIAVVIAAIALACTASAVLLALVSPPAALATCGLLVLTLVYRNAASAPPEDPRPV